MDYSIAHIPDINGVNQEFYITACNKCTTQMHYNKYSVDNGIEQGWYTVDKFKEELYCMECRKGRYRR